MKSEKKSKKQQGKETKEKIFKTAIKLINDKGYNKVTVSEICKEANVSKGGFYVHYESKEDIVRESYYVDMGKFIEKNFNEFLEKNKESSIEEKIREFLWLELKFSEYIGYELTCLSYVINLNQCIPGPSKHNEKREFTRILRDLIRIAYEERKLAEELNKEEAFLFVESSIRGFMASWCFSNNNFNISELGSKYVESTMKYLFNK